MDAAITKRPTITLKPCESSRIRAHGHCPETNTLALQFHAKDGRPGPTYHYQGFTAEKYAELCGCESVGKFFGFVVSAKDDEGKPVYPYTRIEAEATAEDTQ